ncbi:MAG: 2-amino-3-carboxymuconate-6-semialdehyde decarboxylase [Candidatus Marinimicrobia bacterium]|nr:2-amino-3-carboxymuconate-6-semialdehyde decarboxylase [Candidatus Neomarinimicrobiota bacterium]|tara:strand:+ start:68 stop:1084 length:1017 start_codon:yes stop_codon:yes gene_type:complete
MFKIDIHTHILPENLNEITGKFSDNRFLYFDSINENTAMLSKEGKSFRKIECNCWNHKIREKDCIETSVDMQVLATIPALFSYWSKKEECLLLSRFINDHIFEICKDKPSKFLGLGTIPMQDTEMAIYEMDRCINQLNFPGIEIGSNINGLNLSEERFSPIFEHAEKINCSIFIHPWDMMGKSDMEKYWLPWLVGMPAETSRAICSLIFGGVFEKYPDLKICFAHGGGSYPFTSGRIDHGFNSRPDLCAIDNNILPSSYLNHFYVDSLVHDKNAMNYLINSMGINQIALGSDYPFPLGEHYPGSLIESMDLDFSTKQRLFAGTALEWLGLKESDYIGK